MSDSAETFPESKGQRWLGLLGYQHLQEMDTGYELDGQPVQVRDFHVLCEEHAEPVFTALQAAPEGHPKHDLFLAAAQSMFRAHFPKPFESDHEQG